MGASWDDIPSKYELNWLNFTAAVDFTKRLPKARIVIELLLFICAVFLQLFKYICLFFRSK